MNSTILTGRLVKEVELRKTANGVSQCNFVIAVNDGYGEHKKTHFINCVAWRASADFLYQYARKGYMIGVIGKLSTRNYEKDGGKVYVTEVICENVEILASKKQESSQNENVSQNDNASMPNVSDSYKQQPISNEIAGLDDRFTDDDFPWE